MKFQFLAVSVIFGGMMFVQAGEKNGEMPALNGGFEKCQPTSQGVILPTNWLVDKSVTKNGAAAATMKTNEVRNGKFALRVETEPEGRIYVFNGFEKLKVDKGDKVRFSIWGKGSGTFRIGYYCNGLKNGKPSFLTTVLGKNCNPDKDKWQQFEYEFTVVPVSSAKAMPDTLRLVIYVPAGDSELFFDDAEVATDRAAKPDSGQK